jgi:uncharacterized PurR-regulated membrane protein YhhQ (DUF165 family)
MKLFAPLAVAYVALVVLANWLASKYLITVPFTHYLAPAGVLCIGAVLVMRDWIQQLKGLIWALGLIVIAGLISLASGFIFGYGSLVRIALASLAAFAVSEGIIETLIFTPLRKRHFTLGVALSSTAGNAVDSLIFLAIAFPAFWTNLYMGNFVGKLEMIAVGVAITALRRRILPAAAA